MMKRHREYTQFGRQVSYVVGANMALLLLHFIRVPILTKGLGATLYGTWSLIHITISLIVPFALLGLGPAIVRFLAAEKDVDRIGKEFFSVCSIVCFSGVSLSIFLFLFSDYLAISVFRDIDSSFYIKIASILILFDSLFLVTLDFFRMRKKIGLYAILHLGRNALQIGLIILAILLGYKLTGVLTAVVLGGMLFCLINLFIVFRQTGLHIPQFSSVQPYLKWGVPLTLNPAILWIINSSDRYIVSYFVGVTAAGIYHAAYVIGHYTSFVLLPLSVVLYPTVIKSYDEGNAIETKNYLKYSFKYFMMIAIPSAFGLSVLAKPVISILTTSEFVIGNIVVPFVAFGTVFFGFYQICQNILYIANKTHLTVRLLGIATVLNIGLNIILIPYMGIVGAAIATLIAYGILGIFTLIISRRYLKFDLSIPFMLKSTIASAIMMLCIWLIGAESLAMIVLSIFIGIVIYSGLLFLMRGLSKTEINFFVSFVKDRIRSVVY